MAFDRSQDNHVALKNIVGEGTRQIVAWVGSGLSASAGLPTWPQLKDCLLDALKRKAESMDEDGYERTIEKHARATKESSYWKAFAILKDGLGATTYRDTIRGCLQVNVKARVPQEYRLLWRLRVDGVLSLNLDRFAAKAFVEEHAEDGTKVIEFKGTEAGSLIHVLNSRSKFVANLHGHAEDVASWVFTEAELRNLKNNEGYRTFLDACLTTKTVLFVGISADDIAVGSFLEKLRKNGVDAASHFWLTDRRDIESDRWAERNNIRPIRYSNDSGSHGEVSEFFQDLLAHFPEDEPSEDPVVPETMEANACYGLMPPSDMKIFDPEDIRNCLNAKAKQILEPGTIAAYEGYEQFSLLYDELIYRSWYVPTKPRGSVLLGHQIEDEVAEGAFGRIFKAVSPANQTVAIKLLRQEIRRNPELLRCFRRGVRSMKILGKYSLPGMVRYIDASEIPALVTMEWIDGPNLTAVVEGRLLNGWQDMLKVASSVAEVIYSAHRLPERVLHRDIRPSNIMLRGFYQDREAWETVVLDFDLSWHRGAQEESVVHSAIVGYLAPEQMTRSTTESTRHSAVDSFGLGMTFYFMVAAKNPIPEQHRQANWKADVHTLCGNVEIGEWLSVGNRFARMIIGMTEQRQAQRWDFGQITGELERLNLAVANPSKVFSPELIAEELAARTDHMKNYRWDSENSQAISRLATGVVVRLSPASSSGQVKLVVEWASGGAEARKSVSKWLRPRVDNMTRVLQKNGWVKGAFNIEPQSFRVELFRNAAAISGQIDMVAAELRKALALLRFD